MFLVLCLFFKANAQTEELEIAKSDSLITSSYEMKMEILKLRNKVGFLQRKIRQMQNNVSTLTDTVRILQMAKEKNKEEFEAMERYAISILQKNDSINVANDELITINSKLSDSKESIQIAASALQQILDRERQINQGRIISLMRNYSDACTMVTHQTKKGTVNLDDTNLHKLSWIKDMNLNISTCFALPREDAENNVKVYLNLYQNAGIENNPLESNVPIVLTPNREVSDEIMVYYDGNIDIVLPQDQRKELKTSFVFEVEYQEEVIASGKFRLD